MSKEVKEYVADMLPVTGQVAEPGVDNSYIEDTVRKQVENTPDPNHYDAPNIVKKECGINTCENVIQFVTDPYIPYNDIIKESIDNDSKLAQVDLSDDVKRTVFEFTAITKKIKNLIAINESKEYNPIISELISERTSSKNKLNKIIKGTNKQQLKDIKMCNKSYCSTENCDINYNESANNMPSLFDNVELEYESSNHVDIPDIIPDDSDYSDNINPGDLSSDFNEMVNDIIEECSFESPYLDIDDCICEAKSFF